MAAGRLQRRLNGTAAEDCARTLAAAARARPPRERSRLRRALAHGLSVPEAMLAAAPGGAADEEACARVDEARIHMNIYVLYVSVCLSMCVCVSVCLCVCVCLCMLARAHVCLCVRTQRLSA